MGVLAAAWRGLSSSRQVSPRTRREYLVTVFLACLSEAAVRVLPLRHTARLMRVALTTSRSAPRPELTELPEWAIHRFRVVKHLMERWPVDGTCLRQSLVLGNRLRALEPVLKLGVRRDDGVLTAHAWLEIDGRSLDPTSSSYFELPAAV